METRIYNITGGQCDTDVFKNYQTEKDAILSSCIFDKTIPGLGATHSEILPHRHSIIIEPNIPAIMGMCENKKQSLAVYEKTKENEVEAYMASTKIKYKKIFCTPRS